ncbi:MAG: glycosyltransferase family 2 protein [Gammaproteobacteria bacterium]|nr:glycosyltransferase family 2 protein [Gammaproteobacteria bacterium]MBI5616599.1 glycosyltransferase family 2 protein [Gammaproteobacteria bacterium]
MSDTPTLSVVATLYKSAAYVEEFCARITSEARKITSEYEIVLVDDGSPDNALDVALGVVARDPHVRVVELSRNFGHHKAMMTGLCHTRGEFVFLIDIDLEEPPELLGLFYERMRAENWDVVYGYQRRRKGGWWEQVSGALAWRMINFMLPIHVPDNHSTVRLMTRTYVDALVQHKENKTAIGGLWVITGFRQHGVEFVKGQRPVSSYTLLGRLSMLLDSITSFSEVPLFAIFFLGLAILLTSLVFAAYLVVLHFTGRSLAGWISVMVSVWILGGLGIFSVGVVGLYVSRIFIETKGRPYTIVRRLHGNVAPRAIEEQVKS